MAAWTMMARRNLMGFIVVRAWVSSSAGARVLLVRSRAQPADSEALPMRGCYEEHAAAAAQDNDALGCWPACSSTPPRAASGCVAGMTVEGARRVLNLGLLWAVARVRVRGVMYVWGALGEHRRLVGLHGRAGAAPFTLSTLTVTMQPWP